MVGTPSPSCRSVGSHGDLMLRHCSWPWYRSSALFRSAVRHTNATQTSDGATCETPSLLPMESIWKTAWWREKKQVYPAFLLWLRHNRCPFWCARTASDGDWSHRRKSTAPVWKAAEQADLFCFYLSWAILSEISCHLDLRERSYCTQWVYNRTCKDFSLRSKWHGFYLPCWSRIAQLR